MRPTRTARIGILKLVTITTIAGAAWGLGSGPLAARVVAQEKPAPTFESSVTNTWKGLHNKILAMAKDTQFPDDKLSLKPHADSRTVLDEFQRDAV